MAEPNTPISVEKEPDFPVWLLNIGFLTALIFAGSCLVAGGYYLYRFQSLTQYAVLEVLKGKTQEAGLYQLALASQLYLARIQLVSCGIFIGMAFGFLGFGLFLLGIKGQIQASASYSTLKVQVLSLSPGVFVLLCATILVGICITRPLRFDYDKNGQGAFSKPIGFSEENILKSKPESADTL